MLLWYDEKIVIDCGKKKKIMYVFWIINLYNFIFFFYVIVFMVFVYKIWNSCVDDNYD